MFLFVEDFDHRCGYGVIAVVEFDSKGPIGNPRPVWKRASICLTLTSSSMADDVDGGRSARPIAPSVFTAPPAFPISGHMRRRSWRTWKPATRLCFNIAGAGG